MSAEIAPVVPANAIKQQLQTTFAAPSYKPPMLPRVAAEVLRLSQQVDIEFADVAATLEQDSLLASRILRIARSPMYAGDRPIGSIKEALVRLGMRTMRDVVLEAAFNARMFRAEGYAAAMDLLLKHCTATAHVARVVARYASMESEYAFMCGLLHDVGIAGALIVLAEGAAPRPPLEQAWPTIVAMHEQTTGLIGKLWNLPPEVQLVIGHHHALGVQGLVHPLAATICVAEHTITELGPAAGDAAGAAGPADASTLDGQSPEAIEKALAVLGLAGRKLEAVRSDSAAALSRLEKSAQL